MRFCKIIKRFITFKSEQSVNPNAIKLVFEKTNLLPFVHKSFNFQKKDLKHKNSPLAKKIFQINGIDSILIGNTYLTVCKKPEKSWNEIQEKLNDTINLFFTESKEPVFNQEFIIENSEKEVNCELEIFNELKNFIDIRIKPLINSEGGDIELVKLDEKKGIVYIRLKGSCVSCSFKNETLNNGIEMMIKHYFDNVNSVREIDDNETIQP